MRNELYECLTVQVCLKLTMQTVQNWRQTVFGTLPCSPEALTTRGASCSTIKTIVIKSIIRYVVFSAAPTMQSGDNQGSSRHTTHSPVSCNQKTGETRPRVRAETVSAREGNERGRGVLARLVSASSSQHRTRNRMNRENPPRPFDGRDLDLDLHPRWVTNFRPIVPRRRT